jgi:hypothetical protein
MSQEDLLRTIDRLKGMPPLPEEILTPAEARLYQVNLTDLERVTGLDFGHLRDAEVLVTEGARARTPRMIGDFEDVRM